MAAKPQTVIVPTEYTILPSGCSMEGKHVNPDIYIAAQLTRIANALETLQAVALQGAGDAVQALGGLARLAESIDRATELAEHAAAPTITAAQS